MAAVDEHVQRVAVLADERQPLRDEGLVTDREETGVDAQHPGELLRTGAEGVHEDGCPELAVTSVGRTDRNQVGFTRLCHIDQFRVLHHAAAEADADLPHRVDGLARAGLPAVVGNEGVRVDVQVRIDVRGNLAGEVLPVDHVGVGPGAGGVQALVGGFVMDEVHVPRHLEVDVVGGMEFPENLQVAVGDFREGGDGEGRAAAGDATPGTAVLLVHEDRLQARLREVAEQGGAGHAAAGDEGAGFHGLFIRELRGSHEAMPAAEVADVADLHEVRHRPAGREFARDLDAVGTEDLLCTGEAAGAAARAHAQPGDVLEFLRGDTLAALEGLQEVFQRHVLAVADERLVRVGPVGFEHQRLGIILLQDETMGIRQFAVDGDGLHHGDVRLAGLPDDALDHAFAHDLAVVIDQEYVFGILRKVEFQRKEYLVPVGPVTEDGQARATGDAFHATDALVIVDDRRHGRGTLGNRALLAGEGARVAGEAVQAVRDDETLGRHPLGGGPGGFLQHADGPLLGVDIFLGDGQVGVVIDPLPEIHHHFVGTLAAAEDGGGSLADPDGVAHAVAGASEHLGPLAEELVVRQQARADVDAVDTVDADLGSGDGPEVLALGDDGAHDAAAVLVRNGFH